MALQGFRCPDSAPTAGETHEFEHCITRCKDRCMSPYLLAAMASSNSKNHHKGVYISATSLTSGACTRKLYLERLGPGHYMPASQVFYGFRGTITHTVVEEAADWKMASGKSLLDLGYLSEWRMAVGFCFKHGAFPFPETADASDPDTWGGICCPKDQTSMGLAGDVAIADVLGSSPCDWFVLGGTLDCAVPLKFDKPTGTLHMRLEDIKTMQEYAVDKFVFGDKYATLHTHTKDGYVEQMNVYRYLAEQSPPPAFMQERGVQRIVFTEARIQAFAMGRAPYMGTHYWGRKHHTHPYEAHFIPAIEFFEDAWVEEHIRTNGRAIYESLLMQRALPPICPPEGKKDAHSWACDFCGFKDSAQCPNPKAEWRALQDGLDPDAAFVAAGGALADLPVRNRRSLPVLPG